MKPLKSKKFTINEVKEKFEKVDGYKLLSDEYSGNHSKLKVLHLICGKEYTTSYDNFIRIGQRCRCLRNSEKKISSSEFSKRLLEKHSKKYLLIGEYVDSKTNVNIKHTLCNNVFKVNPNKILSVKDYCPYCSRKGQGGWTHLKVLNFIKDKSVGKVTLLSEYVKKDKGTFIQPIEIKFNDCGHKKITRLQDIIDYNITCRVCNPIKLTHRIVESEFNKKFNGEYSLLSKYNGDTHEKLKVIHNFSLIKDKKIPCGHTYFISRNGILINENRCPKCNKSIKSSKAEKEILQYIKELDPFLDVLNNTRSIIKGKELDIFIPSKRIAIEFNGLYWHREEIGGKYRHFDKLVACNEKEIQLIQIFEDEWINKKDAIKNKLKEVITTPNNTSSKNLVVSKRDYISLEDFLLKYSIDNIDSNMNFLAVTIKEEVVSVLSFKKDKNNFLEIGSFIVNSAYNRGNIFDKVLTHLIKNYNPETISIKEDLRFGDGSFYESFGFVISDISDVECTYFKNESTRVTTPLKNYNKIWDCGKILLELKKQVIEDLDL